ncbi:MAG TPA: hypothetical protein VF054_06145 [Micromonosporaceae bacterium]
MSSRTRRYPWALLALLTAAATLAGCGRRVEPLPVPTLAVTAMPSPTGTAVPSPTVAPPLPAPSPSGTGFPETIAVDCAGTPAADRIIALLRARGWLSARTPATVSVGPLCAGTWQYTILSVSGHEPLQVVTEGPPTGLRLVTAGTDICTIEVRTTAPAGIIGAAHCPPPSA